MYYLLISNGTTPKPHYGFNHHIYCTSIAPLWSFIEVKPGQVRCGEHSDYGSITLLFQDDVGGLEVSLSESNAGNEIVNNETLMIVNEHLEV